VAANRRGGRLGDGGSVCGARAQMDEMNSAWGRKRSAGGSVLRGAARRGGRRGGRGVGATCRRSGRERGRERGAWPRCTCAACSRATVESGGVGATRVDVADRWAGARRGPGHQQLGAAHGSAVRWLAWR
jgi:hypothetical protein